MLIYIYLACSKVLLSILIDSHWVLWVGKWIWLLWAPSFKEKLCWRASSVGEVLAVQTWRLWIPEPMESQTLQHTSVITALLWLDGVKTGASWPGGHGGRHEWHRVSSEVEGKDWSLRLSFDLHMPLWCVHIPPLINNNNNTHTCTNKMNPGCSINEHLLLYSLRSRVWMIKNLGFIFYWLLSFGQVSWSWHLSLPSSAMGIIMAPIVLKNLM